MTIDVVRYIPAVWVLSGSLLLVGTSPAVAQPPEPGGEGTDQCVTLREPGTTDFDISTATSPIEGESLPDDITIGKIVFTRYPIFNPNDPKEDNALFRLVDFLHIDTQKDVVRDLLLFETGDRLNLRELEESARVLRGADYLYDARIWPYEICGNRVNVEVLTREVWTLSGGASVERTGGNDDTRVSISDSNFLGRGETLSLARFSSQDRDGYEVIYEDPNVAGTRHEFDVFFADNSDGEQTKVNLQRPFYSLDARYAWGMFYNHDERVDDLYERGEEVASFRTQLDQREVFWGTSGGWENGVTKRWWYGWRTRKENYQLVDGETAPDNFPEDRELSYPFIGYAKVEEAFIQTSNLNQMHRIEDFNLGRTWDMRLGVSDESLGSDRDRLVYQAGWRDAWQIDRHTLTQLEFSLEGMWRYDSDQSESVLFETNWRYYDGAHKSQGTYLALDLKYSRNLPNNEQILLGAEENLRGYPDRYQNGSRSIVFTAERRFYTDWHLFRLLRVGGAVFFDVGRAWSPGDENSGATGWLADAGFGLRIASSRAETKRVLHVDVAFPFEHEDDIDGVQVLVEAKQSF